MNDGTEQTKGYSRKDTINTILYLLWTINTLPLAMSLFFIGLTGFVLSFPLTFLAWNPDRCRGVSIILKIIGKPYWSEYGFPIYQSYFKNFDTKGDDSPRRMK